MKIEILNLQRIIQELTKKNKELQKENDQLRAQVEEQENGSSMD